jgi:hypothetical protein
MSSENGEPARGRTPTTAFGTFQDWFQESWHYLVALSLSGAIGRQAAMGIKNQMHATAIARQIILEE